MRFVSVIGHQKNHHLRMTRMIPIGVHHLMEKNHPGNAGRFLGPSKGPIGFESEQIATSSHRLVTPNNRQGIREFHPQNTRTIPGLGIYRKKHPEIIIILSKMPLNREGGGWARVFSGKFS